MQAQALGQDNFLARAVILQSGVFSVLSEVIRYDLSHLCTVAV